jgi:hypothetical protein
MRAALSLKRKGVISLCFENRIQKTAGFGL